jgi:hypothetical protein
MADVQFVVKGEKIADHLPIVASVSPAMAAMFGAEHCNASVRCFEGKCITINDTPASTLAPNKRQSHYFGAKSLHSFFASQESQPSNDF